MAEVVVQVIVKSFGRIEKHYFGAYFFIESPMNYNGDS